MEGLIIVSSIAAATVEVAMTEIGVRAAIKFATVQLSNSTAMGSASTKIS